MSNCAVFANVYDAPLTEYQTEDIYFLLDHLYTKENVNVFFTSENRRFEQFCRYWVDGKKDIYNPALIYKFPKGDPYEEYFSEKDSVPDIFFADFILCDETTKNFISNHMEVKYIIKRPKTKTYIFVKADNPFRLY